MQRKVTLVYSDGATKTVVLEENQIEKYLADRKGSYATSTIEDVEVLDDTL